MRIEHSGKARGLGSFTFLANPAVALLILALSATTAIGFIAHQQEWHTTLLDWGIALFTQPRQVLATLRARASLPIVLLNMPFDASQRLIAQRDLALAASLHIPAPEDVVSGELMLTNGRRESVEIRLPGGPAAQLQAETWPLEVRIVGQSTWLRLIPVEICGDEYGWLQWGYLETLRLEGFTTADQMSVRLQINGKDRGLHLLQTPATTSPQVSFNAQLAWKALADGETLTDGGFRYATIEIENNTEASQTLAPVTDDYAKLRDVYRGDLSLSAVTDPETLGRFMALTAFWTGQPMPDWTSLRWHTDSNTGLLEPVGAAQPWVQPALLPQAFIDDPAIQAAYARALVEFSNPAYLAQVRRVSGATLEQQWQVLRSDMSVPPWSLLETHQQRMRAWIAPNLAVSASLEKGRTGFVLIVANLQPFPILVSGLDMGGTSNRELEPEWIIPADRAHTLEIDNAIVLRAADGPLPSPVRLSLPWDLTAAGGDVLRLICRIWDAPGPELRVPVTDDSAASMEADP